MKSLAVGAAALVVMFARPTGATEEAQREPNRPPREPDGMLVLAVLSPERAMVADPRNGATDARELPGGTLCHGQLLALGDHVVIFGQRRGHPVVRSLPSNGLGRAVSLGRADTAIPSSPGRVWLGRTARPGDTTSRIWLREVDVDGRVRARSRHLLPRWGRVVAVVDGGVLISRGRGIVLRRPGQPRVRIPGGWPLAADYERFAWCPRGCRRLGVWTRRMSSDAPIAGTRRHSSRTGGQLLDPPRGLGPDPRGQPAFSPDGRRLALPVRSPAGSRVAVIDLQEGRWSVVPGARLAGYRATAWSPSGRWLYFTRGNRVLASRDGVERARRLPIRTGGRVMSIASTPVSAAR
jgi:WD40 repeat protein